MITLKKSEEAIICISLNDIKTLQIGNNPPRFVEKKIRKGVLYSFE